MRIERVDRLSDDQVKDRRGETLFLQEVESAASALAEISDCCCAVQPGHASEMDGLVLFAVTAAHTDDDHAFASVVYNHLTETLGTRRLPARILRVPTIARFTNGKSDRASMLRYLDD